MKHRDIAMIAIRLNNHELRNAFSERELKCLESVTTHIYFPTIKGKSTFDQEAHDTVVALAKNIGVTE